MVFSICKEGSPPSGVTHCVAAHWLTPKSKSDRADLLLVRTKHLEVYSIQDVNAQANSVDRANLKNGAILELEATHALFGEVLAMETLPARKGGLRDAVVLVFDQGQVVVLAWDTHNRCPVATSMHSLNPSQFPTGGRTQYPLPPIVRSEPEGRASAVLMMRSFLAVLPAVSSGVKQSVNSPHLAASVGNSFVIDLTALGIRSARDFCFLHKYHDAVALVLYETECTWAGSLHEAKDTCAVAAVAITSQRKKQPILWTTKRLPSDCVSVTAVPHGGVIILTPSLLIFQNKAARVCLAVNSMCMPGEIPAVPDFEQTDGPQQTMQLAIEMAEKYATNVVPNVVPEVATRADQSDIHADLHASRLIFIRPLHAVLALASGRILHVVIKVEMGRVTKLSLAATGNSSAASALCLLSDRLIFFGSWLGHSNLLQLSFKSDEEMHQMQHSADEPEAAAQSGAQASSTAEPPADTVGSAAAGAAAGGEPGLNADRQAAQEAAGPSDKAPDADGAKEATGSDAGNAAAYGPERSQPSPLGKRTLSLDATDSQSQPPEKKQKPDGQHSAEQRLPLTVVTHSESDGGAPLTSKRSSLASILTSPYGLPGLLPGLQAVQRSNPEPEQAPPADEHALEDDQDDLEELLYQPESGNAHDTKGASDLGTLVLQPVDRLYSLGPVASFAIGEPVASGLQADGKGGTQPVVRGNPQLVACVGAGRSGALACIHGGILPRQIASASLQAEGACTGVWAVHYDPPGDEPFPLHQFLIISFPHTTYVFRAKSDPADALQDISDAPLCEFETRAQTVYACTMFGNQGVVQVCSSHVSLLAGTDLVSKWQLRDALPQAGGSNVDTHRIVSACHSGRFLLLSLASGSAVLLREAEEESRLEEVPDSGAALRAHLMMQPPHRASGLAVAAATLYEDTSGWLSAHLAGAPQDSNEAGRSVYLLVSRAAGFLEVYSLPDMRRAAVFLDAQEGPSTMYATDAEVDAEARLSEQAQIVELHMASYVSTPAEQNGGAQAAQTPDPAALQARRPLLVARTRDNRLYLYRAEIGDASPDSRSGEQLCLRRLPLDWLRYADGSAQRPVQLQRAMVRYSALGVCHCSQVPCACGNAGALYQGVFVCGANPVWLVAHRGTYKVHSMDNREPVEDSQVGYSDTSISAMAPWHHINNRHGFIVVAAKTSELRFSQLPKHVRLTLPNPASWRGLAVFNRHTKTHEGVTPHAITWYQPAKLFFVSTSRRVAPAAYMPRDPNAADDPHAAFAYKLSERVAQVRKGETRFQIRGVDPSSLAMATEFKLKPLESVLALETVKLLVANSGAGTTITNWFVAAGVGVLVTEDWAPAGSVQLFEVAKERVQGYDGEWGDKWTLNRRHIREFTGPVTAVSASEGNLVVGYAHNIEIYRWTGSSLQICAAHSDSSRLVTTLSIIKNQYVLTGNMRKGVAFLHVRDKGSSLALVARDFAPADAAAVDFLLWGTSLAFVQADASGNFSVFKYQKDGSKAYEPAGIRLVPVGVYHVCHKVNALRRLKFCLESGSNPKIGFAVVFGGNTGAMGWLAPLANDSYALLRKLAQLMYTAVPHIAGLNPQAFRALARSSMRNQGVQSYGKPAPLDTIVDGDLVWQFAALTRQQQQELAKAAGVTDTDIVSMLGQLASSTFFY